MNREEYLCDLAERVLAYKVFYGKARRHKNPRLKEELKLEISKLGDEEKLFLKNKFLELNEDFKIVRNGRSTKR